MSEQLAGEKPPARPLHTTTVRFDGDLWDRICLYAELLGVAKATLINMATREFIARLDGEQRPQQSLRALVIDLGADCSVLRPPCGGGVSGCRRAVCPAGF